MRFMTKLFFYGSVLATSVIIQGAGASEPPRAEKIPYSIEAHGQTRVDPYYWLKDRENPKVIEHLEAENRYAEGMLAATAPDVEQLFKEFSARVPRIKDSGSYDFKGYRYWTRSFGNRDYPVYMRERLGTKQKAEEIVLDVNKLAQNYPYFDLESYDLSDDEKLMAYTYDIVGRRKYTLKVVDRSTGQDFLSVDNMTGSFEWFADDLYYTVQDPETLREYQVYRIRRINPSTESKPQYGQPELIFEEDDETFYVSLEKSLSRETLFIHSESTLSDEWHYLSLKNREYPQPIQPRLRGLEYEVKDGGDRFIILTNYEAQDFQVMEVDKLSPGIENWSVVLSGQADFYREGFQVFRDYIVVFEKSKGQDIFRVINRQTRESSLIPFGEQVSVASPFTNMNYATDKFLYTFESLKIPPSVFSYSFGSGSVTLVHQDKVLGYDAERYEAKRVWVPARDGTLVPMSMIYRKGLTQNGQNPALVYGYGSYGYTIEPTFNSKIMSLLDRGFVYAIAHVRGGSMLGRNWYEQGKLLKKMNTFYDFIDCSRYLIDQKWTSPEHLYAQGGSAGGLLMGAIVNLEPELYHGVIAQVPFVDVVTTMLDETIPLTTAEYDEWGDPREKNFYDYMLSYSPYDNVKSLRYPNLLVTSGLHDSQVQYWEPTKWVLKLRDYNVGSSQILLKTNMQAGHGGASGQLQGFKEVAEEWSFLLKLEKAHSQVNKFKIIQAQ
jgi:oligopeptidase B